MRINLPELCLVVLIGTSGSGKSTFARKHFKSTEILSSDFCRGLVSDDENDQVSTTDAFAVLHFIAAKRLRAGKLTVVDATNVQAEARKPLIALARDHHCISVAVVLDLSEKICQERNKSRPDRDFGEHVIRNQNQQLRRSLKGLEREGFRHVYVLSSQEEIDATTFEVQPLWNNKKNEHGPFDIIGDIHGCLDELEQLLTNLGYVIERETGLKDGNGFKVTSPNGRKAIFLGDLVDRGPKTPDVIRLVMRMVENGTALCVPGNHDIKLVRKLKGRDVRITHGLAESLEQLDREPPEFRLEAAKFLDGLVSHYVLDGGNLVVAHAGMKEEFQGRGSVKVRDFALFGETTGETDAYGLPVRYNWAADYRGKATVVYGHTPVPTPEWTNRTINIDTGCVFGGRLTALRYPEKELVSVAAAKMYYEPAKPLSPVEGTEEHAKPEHKYNDLLDIKDVLGKRIIDTSLHRTITIREENSVAALEVMSRFAVDPRWLVYLPPTMSPCETSKESGILEHPAEAFSYFRHHGVAQVVCEEKHMGSRAVVIVCKDEEAVSRRFGIRDQGIGMCYTRTGRRFFSDQQIETQFLTSISDGLSATDFWNEFKTEWVLLDCELMPWSAKAQELLKDQYASVGVAASVSTEASVKQLMAAKERGLQCDELLTKYTERQRTADRFVDAYGQYCWTVNSLADVKLAPFHLLATEGAVHIDKTHAWHMQAIAKFAGKDNGILLNTRYELVNLTQQESYDQAVDWWNVLTAGGGEGMVVKPLEFVVRGPRGLVQPAVKCRGHEYLRIIYGPDYDLPGNIERLRARGLSTKRALALREFALGIEAIERFVRKEPLYRVHECVFAVLAMESEPVDPRL
jgi:protein phosphatase